MHIEKRKNSYLEVFIIAFIIAMSFLLPFMIIDKGPFEFFGDYCVQQVPFYSLVHDAIRSGNIFWNWNTDLGANFIGSYSFYNLGSPFFWLTLPLPSFLVPYTLGPLLALKMATAAVTSYAFIKRFVKTNELAALGGLLYAFSSFSIYDIFFNHFHEPMAFFPLMLIALEEFMVNDRKGMFALTVFINAFVNYFFFIGEVVFIIIYWFIRMSCPEWKIDMKKFGLLAFESLLGVGISGVLFVPSIMQVMSNPRADNMLSGWNLLIYGWTQRMPDIIHSFFFPQDLPSRPNFFPDSGANWSSIAAWLPMFSMTGAIAFMSARKGSWLKKILVVCFVMALVPGLNAMFVLMNDAYYARWFYMPVLMLSLATVVALESADIDYMKGIKWTAIITAVFTLTIGLIPKQENGKTTQYGLEAYVDRFWVYVGIVVLGLAVTYLLVKKFKGNPVKLANYATIGLTIIVCIYGNYFIATGKNFGYDGKWFKSVCLEGADKITLEKPYNYRVDILNGIDNQPMFWKIPTIQAFHSIVPASIMKFYPSVGVTRDVASRPEATYAGLRPLLSVKYLFDPDNRDSIQMPGWVAYGNQLGFKVWKNTNYIPYGFTYSNYITQQEYTNSNQKDRALLKGMLLSETQIITYSDVLKPLDLSNADYTDEAMAEDCAKRRSETCSSFSTDNFGFSAAINLKSDNLVFFSVPYDQGWTATVNGKPAKIEQVNVGFMAVRCDKGLNTIRFNYMTPGLFSGIALTIVSVLILIGYLLLFKYVIKKPVQAAIPASENSSSAEISSNDAIASDEISAGESPGTPSDEDEENNRPAETENDPSEPFNENKDNQE